MNVFALVFVPLRTAVSVSSRQLLLFALTLAVLATTGQAQAQSRARLADVDARLQRVEKVLDQSLLELLQQIEGLQGEVRTLRGEIENLNNDIELLRKRNRDLYKDTDRRITDLEEVGSSSQLPSLSQELSEEPIAPIPTDDQPVFVAEEPEIPQPRTSTGGGSGPAPPVEPVGANTRAASAAEKSGYTKAYDLLAKGNNAEAVAAFDQFLRSYPDGPFSDNAWYWQGEAKYAERSFDNALYNFSVVVEYFPNSPKVPDSRLKIGYALYEQQRYGEAKKVLTDVTNDYPGRSAAVLARKRLQQMTREGR